MREKRYILRHAAGMDWIIQVNQHEAVYVAPIAVNASGAMMWHLLESGSGVEELAQTLQTQFGIDAAQALRDTEDFCQHLTDSGIQIR